MGFKPETVSDAEHDLRGRENCNTERKRLFFSLNQVTGKTPPTPLSADSFWSLDFGKI